MRTLRPWQPAALIAALALLAGAGDARGATPAYLNPKLPAPQRAADLVHRMTLREKASQLVNGARAIPRLGVPAYNWWSEALHGVMVNGTTEFPEPIGLGATFDTAGIHGMAHDIGVEARVVHAEAVRAGGSSIFHGLDFWAPNVNIFRDPRWGRGQETYGEDPFLTARMAVAYVTGMQGSNPRYYLAISTPKHFAVHSGPEPTRHFADVDVSRHDLEDTYLPAFRAAIVEGHAGSVMCAYNAVDGEPACANRFLLQHTLRDAWQFHGYVVSDCDAIRDIFAGHHFRTTQPQASAISLERGMDNECADFPQAGRDGSTDDGDYAPFIAAVQQGYLSESAIDTALVRLFTARIRLGMFDPPSMVPYSNISRKELDSPAHRKLALQLAEESMVLLKNDGVLPLKHVRHIAVVGPLADQTGVLLGNYTGTPTHTVSFLEGLKAEFPSAQITYVPGTPFLEAHPRHPAFPADDTLDPAALVAARNADVVIAVVGITSRLEGEEMRVDLPGFLGGDRTNLAMPKPEESLVQAVSKAGKPLVVVLMNGSALAVGWEKAHADAILEAWYPGEEGGSAIAATLSGRNDPGGRLPVTFYSGIAQLPNFADYSMAGRTYRYFGGKPLWPFGYGLSYTSFQYGDLALPSAPIEAGDPLNASVRVTNSGKTAGDEVVQLYLEFPDVAGAPLRALRAFRRIHLDPGRSEVVRFRLKPRDLSMVTQDGDTIIARGRYSISIGGGQPGTGAPSVAGTFQVSGQVMLRQ
ncbi:MAG TPA: glycoside hydrolase family 3 C-terminal domain-containing protein [Steroidobacteraceae bacterium]|nr:glycoside hydrolase family 3 C-terminal domain-containing protein [Steroidobacteraceae bacterium]